MAHAYAHLYSLPTTGLRFFTVYAPGAARIWRFSSLLGAYSKAGRSGLQPWTDGADFTYVDDIVNGVVRVIDQPPKFARPSGEQQEAHSRGPANLQHRQQPAVQLMDYISQLEKALGKKHNWIFYLCRRATCQLPRQM
jgi:UDP-glucuronate 4-epimerase